VTSVSALQWRTRRRLIAARTTDERHGLGWVGGRGRTVWPRHTRLHCRHTVAAASHADRPPATDRAQSIACLVKAKFHHTGPTGPDRTRTDPRGLFRETRAADPGLRLSPRGSTRVSDKVRGLCLVGSGRAGVVEFSYNYTVTQKKEPVSFVCVFLVPDRNWWIFRIY